MRPSRPKTPVIYVPDEPFAVGGLKILRESSNDAATVIGAGITVFEALKAYDQLRSSGTNIRVHRPVFAAADRRAVAAAMRT
jgi:transketolase